MTRSCEHRHCTCGYRSPQAEQSACELLCMTKSSFEIFSSSMLIASSVTELSVLCMVAWLVMRFVAGQNDIRDRYIDKIPL